MDHRTREWGIERGAAGALIAVALLSLPAPSLAAMRAFDIREGTVADAVSTLGRQGQISVAVRDPTLLRRPAPRVRGTMDARAALQKVAAGAGLQVRQLGPGSYLLLPASAPRPAPSRSVARLRPAMREPAPEPFVPTPEILVMGSKRDTLLGRFAGQFQRIDGRALTRNGPMGTEAIESRSVGLTSTHLGAGRNKLFVRGIADSSFSGPTQSPVGQYVGDMRTGYSGPDPDLRLVDMESVEVLEGPQGTLYGAGTLGGIVLLKPVPARPGRWEGRIASGVSSTAHGEAGLDLSGVLNAALFQGSAIRAVGYEIREGGYIDNRLTGERDVNRVRIRGGRAQFTAELTPDWSVDINGLGQRIDARDSQNADRGRLDRASLLAQPYAADFGLASVVVRKDSGDIRFRSTTGLSAQHVAERFDISDGASSPTSLAQSSRARAVSSETRLWRPMRHGWSWLVGLSSLSHQYRVERQRDGGGAVVDLAGSDNRVREMTAYGEFGVSPVAAVELSAGLRWTRSSLEGSGNNLPPMLRATTATLSGERHERKLLPSLSLSYRPVDKVSLFARYQQGFRPGGLSISSDTARLFRNDTLATSEAGFRAGTPGSDLFAAQGSLSISRWQHIQADFIDSSGLPVTDNIGDGRVRSASLNASLSPSRSLVFNAGIAINDGRIDRPSQSFAMMFAASAPPGSQMRIPNIARLVGRVGARWQHSTGAGDLQAEAYLRYVGKSRLGIGPQLGEAQGNYVDSGLSFSLTRGGQTYSLSATNLADQVGNRFAFGAPLSAEGPQGTPLRPRTIRLGIEQAF